MIKFIVTIVEAFTIGEDDVRVGVLTFGGMAVPQIYLNEYYVKSRLIKAIKKIKYDEKITNTYGKLYFLECLLKKILNCKLNCQNDFS